ncbi:MAG TPA: sigma-70 family RNA polymerase sigma factor [Planctomicrobium sp.]|nr:sigma-70 family RNA polymerase sigma factor [Planctomicrobium sp.]
MGHHNQDDASNHCHDAKADQYEEFLGLFSRDRARLCAYIYSLVPHHADAEDVLQRCSLLLWRKFAEFDRERSFLSWACGIAFYEVRNFLRANQRDRLQFDTDLMAQLAERRVENLEHHDAQLAALRGCVAELRSLERDLVRAAYEGNQALKEFAASTGRASQTLYNRLGRIRRGLMECVERKLAENGDPHVEQI